MQAIFRIKTCIYFLLSVSVRHRLRFQKTGNTDAQQKRQPVTFRLPFLLIQPSLYVPDQNRMISVSLPAASMPLSIRASG